MQQARPQGALEYRAAGRPGVNASGDVEEPLARELLQLTPELVGTPEQRHVRGMLPVGEPDDAREAVRGAVLVQEIEALETEHPTPAPGEMEERGAPHPAETYHDHVVRGHRTSGSYRGDQDAYLIT